MSLKLINKLLFKFVSKNIKISNILFLLIVIHSEIFCSLIKIPFKIITNSHILNQNLNEIVENLLFNYKILSIINIGNPPQEIEASFHIKLSNYFISNYCKNSTTLYLHNKSNTFNEIETNAKPLELGENFYFNEDFIFNYGINNEEITVNKMLLFMPKTQNEDINNCINIGLKFPDDLNNKYQETFIQQLKHKNIINRYFWTMNLYNDGTDNYIGEFIFGDIINDYYKKIDKNFLSEKINYAYTGNVNKKPEENNKSKLDWGIFFEVYYEIEEKEKNKINLSPTVSEFDFGINTIIGTFQYFENIQRDYFNSYISKNICKTSFIGRMYYQYIYCNAESFSLNDLKKFPSLNLKNKDLRYIYTLNYKDLFYLTPDNKFYIFNIVISNNNIFDEPEQEGKWILGLPFWKKYQFSFDTDNKLIFFYNKEGKYIDKSTHKNRDMQDINKEIENTNNDTNITNNQRIIDENKKYNNHIRINKLVFVIILSIFFVVLFFFVIFLVRKTLFKKGYIYIRNKKANELEDDYYSYMSKDIDFDKTKNSNKKELEMQIKNDN